MILQREVRSWMNPIYDFKGQVALVTGAAKGMGLATARMFAESGASVVLADLDGGLAEKEAERMVAEGGTAIVVACDVADEAQVAAIVDRAIAEYGRLDMAFNNAGIQVPPSDAADEPIEHFERVTAVNQRGVWACMKHELRVMREQGRGAIVNCSSLGGLVGLPQRAAYHGTKHAVLGMTKSAGVEYAPRGIRINAVCPGTIDTPMVADMLEGQADAMAEIMKEQSIGRLGRAGDRRDAADARRRGAIGACHRGEDATGPARPRARRGRSSTRRAGRNPTAGKVCARAHRARARGGPSCARQARPRRRPRCDRSLATRARG